jgi:alpha-L-rhamnosidase
MKAIKLRTEYLNQPTALSVTKPRFSWVCEGGIHQTAYRVSAKKDDLVVWDSGKVLSNSMTNIYYDGELLKSRDRIEWSVKLWDENEREGEWVSTWFEVGFLKEEDWKGKWISGNYSPKKNTRYPVDHFKKEFSIETSVKKARLYITACGLYEAKLNGKRVGEFSLAPGCTDYRHRLQYQAHDVTEWLISHRNVLEIELADGWYRGSIGCFGPTNVFGRQTKLLCQLEVTYQDGSTKMITSDKCFQWSNDGPIRFADLKDGEIYDASLIPGYQGFAKEVKEKLIPTSSNNVDVKEREQFKAKLITTPSGKRVLDFGQNIAGFISFSIKGQKGQKVKLRLGEILDEKGEFTQSNIQKKKPAKEFGKLKEILLVSGQEKRIKGDLVPTPKQEVEFICSGDEDQYKMKFSIMGFRYALIETDVSFDPLQFKAIAVYSDLDQTGDFDCSNEKVNRFFENTRWSMKGNFLDIPTDCPTRERLGWTGDAQIFFNTAAYLMNVAPFFQKWMLDIRDGQFKNGKSSAVVPYAGIDIVYKSTGGSVGWNDAVVLIPYRYWKRYGDDKILQDYYDVMRNYAMFMIKNTGHKNKQEAATNPYNQYTYEKGMHLGEWLEPQEFRDEKVGKSVLHTEVCTAYLHYTMRHMAEIASILDKSTDFSLFNEYAEGAKKAYDYLFLQEGTIDTDRQAKLVRPLALGLLEGEKKKNVQERLVKAIENRQYRIGTGFLSTPFVLPTLTEAGRVDVAFKMLENEQSPSWLAEVNAGATTVWEDWEGKDSHNHYSPGAVCEWLFDTVAGIIVDQKNHFKIMPHCGGTLTYAKAQYESIYGKVESGWALENRVVTFKITVPCNTTAEVVLQNGEKYKVDSGTHEFKYTVSD